MRWTERIHLSWQSPQTWAEQLRDQIRALIQSGQLQPGDRLPPVRALAQELGVHFNTVARAYRLLAREGWIALRRGRGAYVQNHRQEPWTQEALQDLAERFVQQAAWLGFDPSAIREAVEQALRVQFPSQDPKEDRT